MQNDEKAVVKVRKNTMDKQFRILSISTVVVWKTRLLYETTRNPTYEISFYKSIINICHIARITQIKIPMLLQINYGNETYVK